MKRNQLFALAAATMLSLSLTVASAQSPAPVSRHHASYGAGSSACGHVHDETCGYTAGHGEIPCDHACADWDGDGVVDHSQGCSYAAAVAGTACQHEHSGSCGARRGANYNGGHHGNSHCRRW